MGVGCLLFCLAWNAEMYLEQNGSVVGVREEVAGVHWDFVIQCIVR